MKLHILNCRLTLPPYKSDSNLQFHIDTPIDVQEVAECLFVQGWVVHTTQIIKRVFLLSKEKDVIQSTAPNIRRPRVKEFYSDYCNLDSAGFELNISNPAAGEYSLVAETAANKQHILAQLSLQENIKPKLLFMHIAKTAGSSINTYLASHYAKDRHAVHAESNEQWRKNPAWARNLGFVSGHFNLPHLKRVLGPTGYYKITVVREPYSHLASHLAWIRKLADACEAKRFAQHPAFVQSFAGKLAKSDLSDPVSISNLITTLEDKEKELVENCQVRYFSQIAVGEDVCAEDVKNAIEASAEFDLIGTTDRIDEFLRNVAEYMEWKAPASEVWENVTRNHYGLDASDKNIREALEPLVRYDLELYGYIKKS